MIERQRNDYLNFYKGIACFGVVFMHVKLPHYVLDGVIQSCFRFAIPLFFMISGYYAYDKERERVEKKLPKKIKNILKVSLLGCVYYFLFQVAIGLFGDSHGSWEGVAQRIGEMFTFQKLTDWLIFNQDPFINIMWFTFALLYCYIALYFINKWNLYRYIYLLIPLLIGANLLLGNILTLFDVDVPIIYYRNFLLYGLPFLMLGNLLHRHYDSIMAKINNQVCIGMIVSGVLISVVEWFLYGRQELYVGSLLLVLGAFTHTLLHPEWKGNSPLTRVGEKYALFIYIVHYSFIIIFDRLIRIVMREEGTIYFIVSYIKPLLIFVACILAAGIFYAILGFLKKGFGMRREMQ